MKSTSVYSPYTALALKIVGTIMIVSSLLDFVILAIPFEPLKPEWQFGFTTQMVDRGIIPMVGIAFLLVGYWISSNMGSSEQGSVITDLRFWALILSIVLGLLFLLLVPLHFKNVGVQSNQALEQISQRADQAEKELKTQTDQVSALVKDPKRFDELEKAISGGQVQGEQLQRLQAIRDQLQAIKQDPTALQKRIDQAKTQIGTGKLDAEKQARTAALKSGLRTGISSLLLAIGYSVIGAMGLRSLGS
ncbi:hormogonium polysaccharide biosynthesis protein HpsJ [Limnofasciculus baicalensis]|uniref:HpsJ family protein n=1 Tax=Limnofasciculus baicalensis BBK-W-15 TaxID=2699891 RepID=A0AAE3GTR2_9CYAN|nr:HpsJ family protein [Limnofasciculus baicalensis]MCP2728377.1 HpsJ family protein [Limnofasciculus baicalensis BBK-W-15]